MPDEKPPLLTKQPAPEGLGAAGAKLWVGIAGKYELRPDELRVLEDAAFEADVIGILRDGMVGQSLVVRGSQGQDVIHPLISELRQHRSTLASLVRQLKLPEDDSEAAAGERSATMRGVANARWSKRGA
jgi:hypothetical protein